MPLRPKISGAAKQFHSELRGNIRLEFWFSNLKTAGSTQTKSRPNRGRRIAVEFVWSLDLSILHRSLRGNSECQVNPDLFAKQAGHQIRTSRSTNERHE